MGLLKYIENILTGKKNILTDSKDNYESISCDSVAVEDAFGMNGLSSDKQRRLVFIIANIVNIEDRTKDLFEHIARDNVHNSLLEYGLHDPTREKKEIR